MGVEPTTFRLRGKCSASGWMGPDGNCLVALSEVSVWTGRVGGSLLVWMINGMIIELSISGAGVGEQVHGLAEIDQPNLPR